MAIKTRQDKGSALTHAEVDNNFKELESATVGLNQTWQDVTRQRSANVIYTNDTGKTIFVHIRTNLREIGSQYLIVDGVEAGYLYDVLGAAGGLTVPIQNQSTYYINNAFDFWSELR